MTKLSEHGKGNSRFGRSNPPEELTWIPATHLLLGAVLVATFAVYSRTLSFQFVYDDHPWLMKNPALHSWRYVGDYFTQHLWAGVEPLSLGNFYRPVFMLWSRINVWVFGANPVGYHLGAVLLHVLVTLLVFFLALQVSSNRNHAVLTSLIFGLHPVHIESVAWILGATDSLAGIFMISSLLCWAKSRNPTSASRRWRVTSWVLFGLGLLAKEIALIFPLLIIVHDYATRKESVQANFWHRKLQKLRDSLRVAAPFLVLILPYLALRVLVLHGFSHPAVNTLPWQSMLLTWPGLFWFYVQHLIWPVGLSTYYELPSVVQPTLQNFSLPLLGCVAIVLLLVCGAVKSRVIAMGASWFVIPVVPALDLRIFSREDFAHDRFLYLASIGYAIIVAYLIQNVPAGRARLFGYSALRSLLTLALATALGVGTILESSYFQDDLHFLSHNLSAAPRNLFAALIFDAYFREHGRYADSAKLLEAVVADRPDDWGATYNLGRDYYKLGRLPEAVSLLTRATLLDPSGPGPYLDLGLTWMRLGQYDRAEAAFREALKLKPDGYGFHFALGIAMMKRGKQAAALEQFKAELRLYPDDSAAKLQIAQMNGGSNQSAP